MMSVRSIKAVLIDLNGTLHVGDKEIPGSVNALKKLRESGLKVRFVSNTTKDTTANLISLVRGLGFSVGADEVFTSIAAAKKLVRDRNLRPLLLLQEQAIPEFVGIETSNPNAVVVGLAKDVFSYSNMNKAFRLLLDNKDAPLIAIHKGKYFKEAGGLSLGPGPFVSALEFATGRTAEIVGKPTRSFFELGLRDLGCSPQEAVMVGDDVSDDVGGAQSAGLQGILVRTGKYRAGDEVQRGVTPDAVVDDFKQAVDWILERTHGP